MFSSPLTTIVGYVILVLTALNQVFVEQGIPKDGKGWITFAVSIATGLGAVFAKDFNVSNAPNAGGTAHHVPPSN
jgi:hypothetical protein